MKCIEGRNSVNGIRNEICVLCISGRFIRSCFVFEYVYRGEYIKLQSIMYFT